MNHQDPPHLFSPPSYWFFNEDPHFFEIFEIKRDELLAYARGHGLLIEHLVVVHEFPLTLGVCASGRDENSSIFLVVLPLGVLSSSIRPIYWFPAGVSLYLLDYLLTKHTGANLRLLLLLSPGWWRTKGMIHERLMSSIITISFDQSVALGGGRSLNDNNAIHK
jgi:hypothetical protein